MEHATSLRLNFLATASQNVKNLSPSLATSILAHQRNLLYTCDSSLDQTGLEIPFQQACPQCAQDCQIRNFRQQTRKNDTPSQGKWVLAKKCRQCGWKRHVDLVKVSDHPGDRDGFASPKQRKKQQSRASNTESSNVTTATKRAIEIEPSRPTSGVVTSSNINEDTNCNSEVKPKLRRDKKKRSGLAEALAKKRAEDAVKSSGGSVKNIGLSDFLKTL